MLRLGLGPQIGTNTPADSGGAQVIWKVAVFGAGTASSNGEYVWNGSEIDGNGFKVYRKTSNSNSFLSWEIGGGPEGLGAWNLFDADFDENTYQIESFTFSGIWDMVGGGASPAPSSALSYAQDSFISSITLTDANIATSNGTYSRISGSTTQFDKVGSTNFIFNDGVWIVADYDEGTDTYQSNDLFVWSSNLPEFDPPPIVSAMVYSA